MKTSYLLILAAAAILLAHSASAELVIYKGTLKQNATGLGVNKKLNSQFYLIVDHNTGSFAGIQFVTVNGSKDYAVGTETNCHLTQLSGPKGKNIETIAHTTNDCDVADGDASETVFFQGTDGSLTVNTGSTIVFPKMFSGVDREVSHSGGDIYIESTLTATFNAAATLLSNGNGETLDEAVARISSVLEGQGYQKQSHESKRSRLPLSLLEIE